MHQRLSRGSHTIALHLWGCHSIVHRSLIHCEVPNAPMIRRRIVWILNLWLNHLWLGNSDHLKVTLFILLNNTNKACLITQDLVFGRQFYNIWWVGHLILGCKLEKRISFNLLEDWAREFLVGGAFCLWVILAIKLAENRVKGWLWDNCEISRELVSEHGSLRKDSWWIE